MLALVIRIWTRLAIPVMVSKETVTTGKSIISQVPIFQVKSKIKT